MAIIDTSKGVRPCVEELAMLENGNVFTKNQHALFPWYIHENASEIQVLKPGVLYRGITIKYEGCGVFSVKGTMDRDTTASRSSSVTLATPIPFDLTYYNFRVRESNTQLVWDCPIIFDSRCIIGEGTIDASRNIVIGIKIPTSIDTWLNASLITGANNNASFVPALGSVALQKSAIPDGVTIYPEQAVIVGFQVVWNFVNVYAGSVFDVTHLFNVYILRNYFTKESLDHIWTKYTTTNDRANYIISNSNILNIANVDNINDTMYTLSNSLLQINTTRDDSAIISPVTNIYHLPTEGE